ncbi:MAG TPA: hypothetical protein VGU01_00410 [Sphingomicrobium sp.]|nr:hypothetical protein [Sphingomicrobium sp.]
MKRIARSFAAAVGALITGTTGLSAATAAVADPLHPAAGVEVWASTDSDKTSVVKLLGRALWAFDGDTKFQGIDIERAWFAPQGQHARKQTRVYLDLADSLGDHWKWSTRIGTNGDTVLGTASIRANDWSKEAFIEREIVETPKGVDQGIYYTFVGASTNLIQTERDTISAMAGFQKFTGSNDRFHLRGTFVHVIKPDLGLSIQLRARYFHSTVPDEFDYYSPSDFVQLIPVLQMRRFVRGGWMVLIAGGYGAQKATGTSWQAARLGEFRVDSPVRSKQFRAFVEVQYSNSSLVGASGNYHYVLGRAGLTSRF